MLSARHIAQSLHTLVTKEGHKAQDVANWFVGYVQMHDREDQIHDVVRYLEALEKREEKENTLHIKTAYDVSDATRNAIVDHVDASQDTPVELNEDASLIGGFIAEYKGVRYNATLKNELKKLRFSLERM